MKLCLPSTMCGPFCSVPPVGKMIVVLPALIASRTSVHVSSSMNTVSGTTAPATDEVSRQKTVQKMKRFISGLCWDHPETYHCNIDRALQAVKVLQSLVPIAPLLCLLLGTSVLAADDCSRRQDAGYRVLAMDNGRKVAVWYPAAAKEQPMAYSRSTGGFMGSVAQDAPAADCPRVPLVLFSHGLGGCALQSLFLTEELARHGYIVAAPDHNDAVC